MSMVDHLATHYPNTTVATGAGTSIVGTTIGWFAQNGFVLLSILATLVGIIAGVFSIVVAIRTIQLRESERLLVEADARYQRVIRCRECHKTLLEPPDVCPVGNPSCIHLRKGGQPDGG